MVVRTDSLRTGLALRDEHLRGDGWLDAAAHPEITFELRRIEGASHLEPNHATRVRLHGRFRVHGVTRDIVATGRVRLETGASEVLHGRASFTVRLTDHQISVPLPMRLKVSNEIRVNVTLRAAVTR